MFSDVRHIFFDLDRTLWDFDKNSSETIRELYDELGLESKGVHDVQAFINTYIKINDYCWELYRQNKITQKELRPMRFMLTFEQFQLNDSHLAHLMGEEYIARSPMKKALLPNTKETLELLSDKYTLHIITNGFEDVQYKKLENTEIIHFFETVTTSEKAGHKKPDRRIFEYALAVSNASSYNSLMVGDDLAADVNGAEAVGMKAVHFIPDHPDERIPQNSISALKELPLLLFS